MTVRMMIITAAVVITTATAGTVAPTAEATARQTTAGTSADRPTAAGTVTQQQAAEAVTGRSLAGLLPPRPRVGSKLQAGPTDAKCDAGSFCAWSGANFTGKAARLNLQTANPNQCVPLPEELVAKSLVNAMTKDVSVYEGVRCSTEAEFTTYPKGGVYVPNAPFVVRAIQVWE